MMTSNLRTSDAPRLRFAPSPTGYLHVGGARTALFNWLFARHHQGTLILRIEDTDFERSTTEMVEGILVGLRWLGIDWDEGPYFQSQRMDLYRTAAQRLVESGHAYCCFCTKEELEQRRADAQAQGGDPQYDRKCRTIMREQAKARRDGGDAAAVRFAVPESGSTVFDDAVFGRVEFANSELEDFVLLRSDGVPTYHLSVVVDDIDMRMTRILRGADHLSNTPKQVMLYQALGAPLPIFAHLPLILGPDKTRLSKRHGATSVIAYQEEGIVPEAFRNFLALLGWTPPDSSQEIMDDRAMIDLFDLSGIAKSNAVFDRGKLDWFNTEYIRACPAVQLLPLIEAEWKKVDLIPFQTSRDAMAATVDLLKPRTRNLKDFATLFRAYFSDSFAADPAAVEKFLKDNAVRHMLVELASRYEQETEFSEASTERVLREFAEKHVKAGVLINAARVVLTGQGVAPSLFAVMANLEPERTMARLKKAITL
jgi:glutamyl-tRNA synthetase